LSHFLDDGDGDRFTFGAANSIGIDHSPEEFGFLSAKLYENTAVKNAP